MTTGENSGTWGGITNTNLGTAIEEAICRSVDVPFSGNSVTLAATNSNTTQSFRNLRLNLTGTGSAGISLIVPDIEKNYIVNNGLATDVDVKNSTGANVTVQAGKSNVVYSTGSGVVDVVNSLSSLVVEGDATFKGATNIQGGFSAGSIANFGGAISGKSTLKIDATATFSSHVNIGDQSSDIAVVNSQIEFNNNIREQTLLRGTSATGTINFNLLDSSVIFNNASAAANFQINIRGDASTGVADILATGETTTCAFMNLNGSVAYYLTALQIDGSTAAPIYWQGGSGPNAGSSSAIDSYLFSVTRTAGTATYTTIASQTTFGLDNY